MTETEWRMVGFGMACARLRWLACFRAIDDGVFAHEAALPPHERRRAVEARRKDAEAERAAAGLASAGGRERPSPLVGEGAPFACERGG
jgi:hypothetical protein